MVLPLLSCSISRVESLHYIIMTSLIHIKGTITCFILPFLECERWKYQSMMINYIKTLLELLIATLRYVYVTFMMTVQLVKWTCGRINVLHIYIENDGGKKGSGWETEYVVSVYPPPPHTNHLPRRIATILEESVIICVHIHRLQH